MYLSRSSIACALVLLTGSPLPAAAQAASAAAAPQAAPSDLDAFMQQVLERRTVNREMLNQYVVDEAETFEVLGPGQRPLHRTKRDFTWYQRDGMHVRSPVRFNGVAVGEEDRRAYERDWVRSERARRDREARNEQKQREAGGAPEGLQRSGVSVPTEPRFVSEAYFMDFKFEPGNYYLAGRERLEGQEVLRIEYYPTNLFNEEDDEKTPHEMKRKKEDRKGRDLEHEFNRKMNKTALVTLWVAPAAHQIVKYTFDNVWLDFLPAAWLVRIDDLRASMTMGQPFPGVWLPRRMNIHAGLTLAPGSFEVDYERLFTDYREGEVKTTIKIPKVSGARVIWTDGGAAGDRGAAPAPDGLAGGSGPFAEEPAPPVETVREIRVHGNASLADTDVLKLAGIALGDPVSADTLAAIERRLEASGRFETLEVRKRYRSLDDPTDVAIVLVVHERPGVTAATTATAGPMSRAWDRLTDTLLFFPILGYADGYGFTYGARLATVDLLGADERLSVPLTWGGTRRAALEAERTFGRGPLSRAFASLGIQQRENPHFDLADRRVAVAAGAERQLARIVRLGVGASRSAVHFGALDDRIWTFDTSAAVDTRDDPAFPANAVLLGGGWSALHVQGRDRINRYEADARGYLRLVGQSVAAGHVQYFTTDAALPPYEKLLLGGASNLRGFRTGSFAADRALVTSGELRVPLTSVLSGARVGVTLFMDAVRGVDYGARLQDAEWRRGAGAGLFIMAPLVTITLDVAHGLDGGATRLHLGTGFRF